jgi:hypothetical protein
VQALVSCISQIRLFYLRCKPVQTALEKVEHLTLCTMPHVDPNAMIITCTSTRTCACMVPSDLHTSTLQLERLLGYVLQILSWLSCCHCPSPNWTLAAAGVVDQLIGPCKQQRRECRVRLRTTLIAIA